MKMFHFTTSYGRSDSITVESSTKSKLLTFLTTYSDAVIKNIKEIVFSKEFYSISQFPLFYVFYLKVKAHLKITVSSFIQTLFIDPEIFSVLTKPFSIICFLLFRI